MNKNQTVRKIKNTNDKTKLASKGFSNTHRKRFHNFQSKALVKCKKYVQVQNIRKYINEEIQ